MKRSLFLRVLLFSLFVSSTACQEDIAVDPEETLNIGRDRVINLSDNERAAYHYKHMKTLAKGLLYMAQNPEFRTVLYSKIDEKFDGEPNVLIELLAEAYGKEKLYQEIQQSFEQYGVDETFENGLQAFDFRETTGEQYFPHIAIFFRDESQPNVSVRTASGNSLPVILIENPLSETDAEPGYTLDEKGNLVQMDTLVTEEYAKENEVWVLAQNERVKTIEQARTNVIPIDCDNPDCIPPPNRPPNLPPSDPVGCNDGVKDGTISDDGIAIIVDRFRVTTHKESWYRGGSEVQVVVASTSGKEGAQKYWTQSLKTIDDPIVGSVSLPTIKAQADFGLAKASRTDVKNKKPINIYRNITYTGWVTSNPQGANYTAYFDWKATFRNAGFPKKADFVDKRADNIIWAMYEYDNVSRKSTTITWSESGNSGKGTISFPSRDGEYNKGVFSSDINSKYYPCYYTSFGSNYLYAKTKRGTRQASFSYDGK